MKALISFYLVLLSASVSAFLTDDVDNHYIVEVLAVLDKPMFDTWSESIGNGTEEQIRAEMTAMFYEVNMIYQSLRAYNLSIEVRIWDIVFAHEHILPEENVQPDGYVWERQVDSYFAQWLKRNTQYRGWDHAMIITSHKMKGYGPVKGVAAVGQVCSFRGRSRVSGEMNFKTVVFMAHELGHSLGALHDSRKKPECGANSGFVMSRSLWSGSRNRWYFSPCTAKTLKWALGDRGRYTKWCLRKYTTEAIVSRRLGEILTPKTFCSRGSRGGIWGPNMKGENVCNMYRCRKWKTDAAEGAPCGRGRKCFKGHCV